MLVAERAFKISLKQWDIDYFKQCVSCSMDVWTKDQKNYYCPTENLYLSLNEKDQLQLIDHQKKKESLPFQHTQADKSYSKPQTQAREASSIEIRRAKVDMDLDAVREEGEEQKKQRRPPEESSQDLLDLHTNQFGIENTDQVQPSQFQKEAIRQDKREQLHAIQVQEKSKVQSQASEGREIEESMAHQAIQIYKEQRHSLEGSQDIPDMMQKQISNIPFTVKIEEHEDKEKVTGPIYKEDEQSHIERSHSNQFHEPKGTLSRSEIINATQQMMLRKLKQKIEKEFEDDSKSLQRLQKLIDLFYKVKHNSQ